MQHQVPLSKGQLGHAISHRSRAHRGLRHSHWGCLMIWVCSTTLPLGSWGGPWAHWASISAIRTIHFLVFENELGAVTSKSLNFFFSPGEDYGTECTKQAKIQLQTSLLAKYVSGHLMTTRQNPGYMQSITGTLMHEQWDHAICTGSSFYPALQGTL